MEVAAMGPSDLAKEFVSSPLIKVRVFTLNHEVSGNLNMSIWPTIIPVIITMDGNMSASERRSKGMESKTEDRKTKSPPSKRIR
mmetsp:Transcript_115373/g.200225  ORF Transcript_115373/g.200225 Transcript_115373/m.200225 type:complete len:84 (+) Transcript_115373:182-433(+)